MGKNALYLYYNLRIPTRGLRFEDEDDDEKEDEDEEETVREAGRGRLDDDDDGGFQFECGLFVCGLVLSLSCVEEA